MSDSNGLLEMAINLRSRSLHAVRRADESDGQDSQCSGKENLYDLL